MALSTEQLKKWGNEGFFVGPVEDEETFVKRVYFLKLLRSAPQAYLSDLPPSLEAVKEKDWESLLKELKDKIGCCPKWIIAHYSNYKLTLWQGAASWIYTSDEGVKFPLVQLNKRFKQGSYLFYSREEVLCHETLHAVRSSYSESRFEEIFAYSLSKQKWRAFLGPIFRTPIETLFFSFALIACMGAQVLSLFFIHLPLFAWLKILAFSPFIYFFYLALRLLRDQRLLKRALGKIRLLFSRQEDPFPLALRLTDAEVRLFAESSLSELRTYIESQRKNSLRWKQIYSQFPVP